MCERTIFVPDELSCWKIYSHIYTWQELSEQGSGDWRVNSHFGESSKWTRIWGLGTGFFWTRQKAS